MRQDPVSRPGGPERAKADSGWRSSLKGDLAGGLTAGVLAVPGAAGLGILALSPLGDQYISHGILTAKGLEAVTDERTDGNRVLLRLGAGNMVGACFGGIRCGVNMNSTFAAYRAGARSRAAVLASAWRVRRGPPEGAVMNT